MCGIAGFVEAGSEHSWHKKSLHLLGDMLECIENRGPDDYGMWFWEESSTDNNDLKCKNQRPIVSGRRLALGHRRLSIIDITDAGHQPMQSVDEDLVIVFNGEIYNYLELKSEIGLYYDWRTHSDTEVLLAAYKKWGNHMLPRLDGMFAFVILDLTKKVLFGARDVTGIKPFYYKHSDGQFSFASEPKALRVMNDASYCFDSQYLSEFLLMGISDHDQGTTIKEIKQLKGGFAFNYHIAENKLHKYSYKKWEQQVQAVTKEEFKETLVRAVRRQLRSDVPVGTSLSGGLDSSTIASIAGEILNDKKDIYQALTFTMPNFPNDESHLAQQVAAKSGLLWHSVSPDITSLPEELEQMIINMGEPFSSLSMFAQYKVMDRAHNLGIKVMLDGQGGDELYLGYPRMAQRAMMVALKSLKIATFIKELRGLKNNLSIPYRNSILGNIYFNSKKIALARRFRIVSKYVHEDYLNCFRPEVAADLYAPKGVYEKQKDELLYYCLPRLLRFADRNSMAFSVESRVPHLSNLMIDLAMKLPLNQKVHNGWTKYILRISMQGDIPDDVLWSRVKRGFAVPHDYWLENIYTRIEDWISGLNGSSPFHREAIIRDLENPANASFLWPVLSCIALNQLSNIKF